jgi:hypothetical protein
MHPVVIEQNVLKNWLNVRHGFTFVPHSLVTDRPYPKPFGGFAEKRVL